MSVTQTKPLKSSQPSSTSDALWHTCWRFVLVIAILAVAFAPTLITYFDQLWRRPYYRFFPFALLTTFGLAFIRAEAFPNSTTGWIRITVSILVFLSAGALTVLGSRFNMPWIGFLCFIAMVGVVFENWSESGTDRSLLYLIIPLAIVLRPPLNLDEEVIHSLQGVTSQISSSCLAAIGIEHIRAGNVIEPLVGPALLVEEACSGVQSLFTLMFLAAFLGSYHQYAMIRTLLLIGCSVFWALGINIFRVMTIAIAQTRFATDLSSGWQHEAVGYAGIVLAFGFLLSTDRLLAFLLTAIPDDPLKNPKTNVIVRLWNWVFYTQPTMHLASNPSMTKSSAKSRFLIMACCSALMIVVSFGSRLQAKVSPQPIASSAQRELSSRIEQDWIGVLPETKVIQFDREQRNPESQLGEYSVQWIVQTPFGTALHSVDFWFDGWHDLPVGYQAIGWKLMTTSEVPAPDKESDWPVNVATFTKPSGEYAVVCFSLFDNKGQPIIREHDTGLLNGAKWRLQQAQITNPGSIQIQSQHESPTSISATTIEQLVADHVMARRGLKERILAGDESAVQKDQQQ